MNPRFYFVLLAAGASIGLGSLWLYPYLSFRFSGTFLIPYSIAILIIAVPLLILEFSVSQHTNKNIVDMFASVRKWLSLIGWFMLISAFILTSIYAVLLSWNIVYFFVSFGQQWKHNAAAYFFNNVVQVSESFGNFTHFSMPLFIALIIGWVILFYYIRKGYESMKRLFLFSVLALLVLMVFFFIYSLTLDSALIGIYAFLKPNFSMLINLNTWVPAFSLAVVSTGVGFGVMHAFARKSRGFLTGASFIVAIFELIVSIAVSFIVFAVLGFLSAKKGIELSNLVFFDFASLFTKFVEAFPLLHKPAFLSLLFFIFVSIFLIVGAASLAYAIVSVLAAKLGTKERNAAIIIAGFGFLLGLLFIAGPGFYIMDIVSHFLYYNILVAVLLEVVAIGWFFDIRKVSEYINHHSLLKMGALWRITIKYITPLIVLLLIFLQLKSDFGALYKGYPLIAVLVFGAGTVLVPLVVAFLMPHRILDRK